MKYINELEIYEIDDEAITVRIDVNDDETVSLSILLPSYSPTASQYDDWFYSQYEIRDKNPWEYQREQEEHYSEIYLD
jgi:hypothetical protein